jgi:hypothetical protein
MPEKKEVIKKENTEIVANEVNPEKLLSMAIQNNLPVESLERLMAMRKELKAEWAKEQYYKSLSAFQSECPIIVNKKDGSRTKSGQVAFKYAPIEDIIDQVKDLLEKHGFSYSFDSRPKEHGVLAIIQINHIAGHSETKSMELPLPTKTSLMSDTQLMGSAQKYGNRYVFKNAFGIMTGDEDLDNKTFQNQNSANIILKDVAQKNGLSKDLDSQNKYNELLNMALSVRQKLTPKQVDFFNKLHAKKEANIIYPKEQYEMDKTYVISIIESIKGSNNGNN